MKTRKPFVPVSAFLALVAVGGGLLVWSLPTLRADQQSGKSPRALLQIATRPPQVLFSTFEQGRSSGDSIEDYRRYVTTQIGLIKSQPVLNAAQQDSGVSQLPSIKDRTDRIAWLKQNLEVTNLKDTEILQISLASGSGASGSDQAAIINAVVRAYMNEVANVDISNRADRHKQLKEVNKKYEVMLRERRAVLRKLSSSVGRGGPLQGLARDVLPRLYRDLRTQQVKLRLERAETETLLARRKGIAGPRPIRSAVRRLPSSRTGLPS
jgi:polysaccharide biosynthesis transport protein